jgi:hypothetical protein
VESSVLATKYWGWCLWWLLQMFSKNLIFQVWGN